MKKKILILLTISLVSASLVGCSENINSTATATPTNSPTSTHSYSSHSSSSSKTTNHYCQADGCTKGGVKTITGLSGKTEYYCQSHYNEIQSIIGNMEKDVGKGSASKHKCEACSKEGTHTLVGLSGATEYYCTQHYNQMADILDSMINN